MKAAWVAAGALVAAGTMVTLSHPAIADVSWPLYLAREVLHGARLTVDFQEINPPLFVWMSLPAAVIGDAMGVALWPIEALLVGAMIAGSLVLCDAVLKRSPFESLRPFLLVCLAFIFAVLPLDDATNREHLTLVLTAPYVLLAAVRLSGSGPTRPVAVLAGVLGALGFALKPYFLIAWILIEAMTVSGQGVRAVRRIETVVLALVGTCYAVGILAVEPGYLRLAVTWAGLYSHYIRNSLWFSMFPNWWSVVPLFAAGTVMSLSIHRRVTPLHRILVVAAIGFWAGAVIQRKGFPYHYLAGAGYGLLAVGLAAREAGEVGWRKPSGVVLQVARAALVVGSVVLVGVLLRHGLDRHRRFHPDPDYPRLLAAVRAESRGGSLLVLSSNPAVGWPLTLEAGVTWASRFMSQWQLSALYDHELWNVGGLVRFRPWPERVGVERTFDDAMLEDLLRHRPGLIVVLRTDPTVWGFGGATRLDYLAYFRADPRFDAALRNYEELAPVGRYRLFRRR